MKIKSIIDVITNSSTEVFILKTKDLEDAKKEIYTEDTKKYLDQFVNINSIEDIKNLYLVHTSY